MLRLVFLLYAEERGLLSKDATFVDHYSVVGLFERLREDAGLCRRAPSPERTVSLRQGRTLRPPHS